jgi:uncharacterized protein YprB with RNaseH-like and TPR domain
VQDIQEQLSLLRRRIARIDRKYSSGDTPPRPAPREADSNPARYFVDEWLAGQEVTTPHGSHFETERLWESHRRHGSIDISALQELPHDLLDALSAGAIRDSDPTRWAFLDTETTGLAGGSGTYAFLIGVGRITSKGFHLRQFFMREQAEEASLLHRLAEYLGEFETLVTYNGKIYDQPLLETRYRLARSKPPFGSLEHMDLLFGARRLWKLRFDSCRLVELENQILGVEREGDLPGEMIPYVYFDYLRTREVWRIVPILHHNAIDILTLACLTAIVPWAFRDPENAPLAHGAEMVGVARWLAQAEQQDKAIALYRRAIEKGLRDELLFRTMWDVACLEKRLGNRHSAIAVLTDLAASRNPFRHCALEELAKHYEHVERNYTMALDCTLDAMRFESSAALHRRRERLERRIAKRAANGSLL